MDQRKITSRRQLGSTGIELSPLGLGTVKFGRNQGVKYPEGFELPSEEFLADFLKLAQSYGINTIDTAPAYGSSEARLGRLLQGQREDWTIIGKAGEFFENGDALYDFSADTIEKSINDSLKRLDTDYIDVLLLHSNGNDVTILKDDKLINRLHDLKSQGLIKAHGISSKTVDGGKLGLDLLDCVMVMYSPTYDDELPVIDYAQDKGKGILLKKILNSGHLAHNVDSSTAIDPVEESLTNAFAYPCITSAIVGTINPDHLKHNVDAALRAMDKYKKAA